MLALYRAYFVEDQDISSPETTADALAEVGLDPVQALAATNDPAIKERLKNETQTPSSVAYSARPMSLWMVNRSGETIGSIRSNAGSLEADSE